VIDGVMNTKIGKTETLHETLGLFHIVNQRQFCSFRYSCVP
jgi:hypothetical protein